MPDKILVLGAAGMLGHVVFTELVAREEWDVRATVWTVEELETLPPALRDRIKPGIDATRLEPLRAVLDSVRPKAVINCVGLIKQRPLAKDPIAALDLNALLPHRLAQLCRAAGSRLIHISTDCVFAGTKGKYKESDSADAEDLYGKTKFLGEVTEPPCVTLRTSIIGHELRDRFALIEWFLSQEGRVRGYRQAIYTGFPTVEFASILARYVLPRKDLFGLYHVSSDPISKHDLLRLVAERYHKDIAIEPDDAVREDRSLNSDLFRRTTGYVPPPWPELLEKMHRHYVNSGLYQKLPGGTHAQF